MQANELIPSLALFTLLAAVAVAILGYALFKSKRANRHPMSKSPDGAILREGDGSTQPATILATDEQGRNRAGGEGG